MAISSGSPISAPSGTNVLQNFSDATAGRSQQLFHCMGSTDSTGISYVLMRDAGVSLPLTVEDATFWDIDFDITINKPTIFAGLGAIDVKFELSDFGGSGATTASITFNLYHYDGSTETLIGTVQTQEVTWSVDTIMTTKLKINITRKLFKIGDTLRLTAIGASDNAALLIMHFDPQTAGNELKLWMPVVNLE